MKKTVIFDLDGTLLNTLDDLAAAGNHALSVYGFPAHPVEAFKVFVGNGVYNLVKRMSPPEYRENVEVLAGLKAAFDSYYSQHSADLTAPYDGVAELIESLVERGTVLSVLSNKPHAFTGVLAERFFSGRLAVVHGQREGYPVKPDRALVDEILEKTGFTAEEALYVGDSGVDMQTATNAGVFAVGVLWGFRDRAELEQGGANICIAHPQELCALL